MSLEVYEDNSDQDEYLLLLRYVLEFQFNKSVSHFKIKHMVENVTEQYVASLLI